MLANREDAYPEPGPDGDLDTVQAFGARARNHGVATSARCLATSRQMGSIFCR